MKKLKKLQLNRETLRNLTLDKLAAVQGGDWWDSITCSFACTVGCPRERPGG